MDADELVGLVGGFRKVRDRQGGGVGGEDRVGAHGGQHVLRHFGFHLGVLEDGLDDQVRPRQSSVIGGGGDAAKHLRLLLLRHLAALHALVEDALGVGFALVRGLLCRVDQDHLDPCIGGDIGDARAHHARADDADLLHALVRHGGAVRALFERLLVDEERPDHGGGGGVHQDMGEPAGLNAEGCVEIDKRAFVDSRQQRLGGGVDALGLAVDHGGCAHEGHEARRMVGRAAGHLVALLVPGFHDISVGGRQDPFLGAGQEVLGGHDLIHELRALRLLRVQHPALQQHGAAAIAPTMRE
jgi:hypothetical protein